MDFVKMHGLGNDFVILDLTNHPELNSRDFSQIAVKLCNRNFGVGADGIILVLPSQKDDIRMRIFNADGSEAEMCGNGIRCFAKYVYERNIVPKTEMKVETLAGTIVSRLEIKGNGVANITVDMGKPRLERSSIPMKGPEGKVISEELEVDGELYKITAVSMGNPHCVIFVDELEKLYLKSIGPRIETHPAFPQKTNVEFVKVEGPDEVTMRVWERGAGETMACGTGACAVVVAGVLNNKIQRKTRVNLPGGVLLIEWSSDDGRVYMTGPATQVFEGRLTINL